MVSSVSSECVFSSIGITICKCYSWLKPDIIEALQFIKSIYHQELLFCKEPSTRLEAEKEKYEVIGNTMREEEGVEGEKSWDGLVGNLQDDKGLKNINSDDVFIQTIV